MIERKVEYVEPDSPERCQGVHAKGQCRYRRVPNSLYCPQHGGNKAQEAAAKAVKRQYQLAKWQQDTDSFADEDAAKSLRGEIGITRLLLQETVARCKDGSELLMFSGKIGDLITKIERLVCSCHRLETNLGHVLDKSKVLDLAAQMVEIISKHVTDDTIIATISDEIVAMVLSAQGKEEVNVSFREARSH